jgi:hypothetical protein
MGGGNTGSVVGHGARWAYIITNAPCAKAGEIATVRARLITYVYKEGSSFVGLKKCIGQETVKQHAVKQQAKLKRKNKCSLSN